MTGGAIRTKRLTLRPFRPEDAAAVTAGIAHWEVIRWLTSPPWPFTLADAESFLASPSSKGARAIEFEGALIGAVHLNSSRDLGYWLNPGYHGRGLMTEAAAAAVGDHFEHSDETLVSGHLPGNAPSSRVLFGLGFRYTKPVQRPHRGLGQDVTVERMELTAAEWRARCA